MTTHRGSALTSPARFVAVAGALAAVCFLLGAPAAEAADVFKGREVYVKQCSVCHGASGAATMAGVPDLSRGEGMMQPDPALLGSIKAGINGMPGYVGILSDREILDVIAFMRTLMR